MLMYEPISVFFYRMSNSQRTLQILWTSVAYRKVHIRPVVAYSSCHDYANKGSQTLQTETNIIGLRQFFSLCNSWSEMYEM